jgi:hypothetical protein
LIFPVVPDELKFASTNTEGYQSRRFPQETLLHKPLITYHKPDQLMIVMGTLVQRLANKTVTMKKHAHQAAYEQLYRDEVNIRTAIRVGNCFGGRLAHLQKFTQKDRENNLMIYTKVGVT